jgi:hypothetical protein
MHPQRFVEMPAPEPISNLTVTFRVRPTRDVIYTNSMQRVSECESVVFCGAAARRRRGRPHAEAGGRPPPAQNISLHSEGF